MKRTILSTFVLFVAFFINVSYADAQNSNRQTKLRMKPNTESIAIRKNIERHSYSDKWRIRSNKQLKPYQIKKTTTDGKVIYGWSVYNNTTWGDNPGLRKFNTGSPSTLQTIGEASTEFIEAGAFAEETYYLFALYDGTYPKGLYSIDMESGDLTRIADYMEDETVLGAIDMTYDYSTSTMYMLVNKAQDNSGLRSVDLQTGKQTEIVADLGYFFRTIAADKDGNLYGIASVGDENDGRLFKIDIKTGNCTDIGSTGVTPLMYQSMDFDRGSNTLYWASYNNNDESVLYIVNTTDAGLTSLGTIGDNDQMVALHIPFDLCDPKAPAAVSEFTVTPDAQGAGKAVLTWTNPDKTYDGSPLNTITKIEILRDKEIVEMMNNPATGSAGQWEDNTVTKAGIYRYEIIAYNAIGAGATVSKSVFIGHDLPAAAENATANRIDKKTIKISWDAVTEGINNGYLEQSSIRYRVVRENDKKEIATNLTATTCNDNTITALAAYSYSIETYNADGTGATAYTDYVVTGPAQEIPFDSDFGVAEQMNVWEVEDRNNDGFGWLVGINTDTGEQEFLYTGGTDEGDDWLISPILSMQQDGHYKVVADAHCYDYNTPETFSILLVTGEGKEIKADLGDFTVTNVEAAPYRVNIDMNKNNLPTGEYRIVIKGTTAEGYGLFMRSVSVGNDEEGNIRGSVYDTSDEPIEGMKVSVGEDFQSLTNADGEFEIKFIPEGTYTLTAVKLGYKDLTETVTVKKWESLNKELTTEKRSEYKLSGKVSNEYGEPMPNANIAVSGYNTYTAKTDVDGTYNFNVYESETDYTLEVSKSYYEPVMETASIRTGNVSKDFVLKDKILPPHRVKAEASAKAMISWQAPAEMVSIDYSSDNSGYGFGADEYDGNTITGVVYRHPVSIEKISWLLLAEDDNCNIILLDLNENQEPTSTVLFRQDNVENTPYERSEFELPEAVNAPRGCVIAVSANTSYLMLGTYTPDDAHPFMEQTNVYCENYSSLPFEYVESYGDDYRENFAIHAEGTTLPDAESPKITYNIYRGNDLLNNPAISSTAYEDKNWSSLADGDYTYDVEAVYRNNSRSDKTRSNTVNKNASGINAANAEGFTVALSADKREILISKVAEQVAVYTTDGKQVATSDHTDRIAVSPTKGLYLVKISDSNATYIRKLIID